MGVLLLACALVQSSSALVLTGLRAPTVRAGTDRSCEHRTFGLAGTDRSGVRQLQARLSEEDGGTVCVILDDDDVQQVEGMFEKQKTGSLENNPMSGDWLFCKEPPDDPSVTCFLAEDVDWLDGKAPEGSPWLCSDSPAMRESPHEGGAAWPKVTT